jgi:hypothetical protein
MEHLEVNHLQMAATNFSGKENDEWVVDIGATNHIICNVNLLSKVHFQTNIPPVPIPNGVAVQVPALGQVRLGTKLTLKRVLGVLDFRFNLLSISKLTNDLHCAVTFMPNSFVIQNLASKKLIGVGRE